MGREGHHGSWWFPWSLRQCASQPFQALKDLSGLHGHLDGPSRPPQLVVVPVVLEEVYSSDYTTPTKLRGLHGPWS
ncbi:hypothetical protein H5410_055915 [Solanum commersonii]|uniref:Uncharacterized protein n=1 Tax=Solanum commersonii TaxID=4109 RepID=A0A9J5WK64_SOLCO|nr:hypothetical protein H5410_055915 [Solanum commersonii]